MSATEASRLLIQRFIPAPITDRRCFVLFDFAFPAGALRLPAFLLPALRVPFRPGHGRPGFRRFGLDLARRHGPDFPVDVEDDAVRVLELAFEVVGSPRSKKNFQPARSIRFCCCSRSSHWKTNGGSRLIRAGVRIIPKASLACYSVLRRAADQLAHAL
jgi:hypothetical protein